jgi:hypothetical protein
VEDILQKLDDHEIGLWHEVGQGDQWTPLGEFLTRRNEEQARQQLREREGQSTEGRAPGGALAPRSPGWPEAGRVELPPRPGPGRLAGSVGAVPLGPGQRNPAGKGRNRKLFIALGALLGFTGAHNFYAGYWGTGLVQAILAVGTTLLGFGFIVSWLWALVELLVVHTDAQGRRMK